MKRLLITIILILIISSPVLAFSIRDFLNNFREVFTKITGTDTAVFNPNYVCTQGTTRCGTVNECSGSPCVMQCQNNQWGEYQYCQEQCNNGTCISTGGTTQFTSGGTGSDTSIGGTGSDTSIGGTGSDTSTGGTTQPTNGGTGTQQTCQDGTLYNQCSNNKPYFCNNGVLTQNCNTCGCPIEKECRNNQCVEINYPYDPGGRQNNDRNQLNHPPLIMPISQKITKIGESIKFEIRAIDQDNNNLKYSLKTIPEIVSCILSENIVECTGVKEGEGEIIIVISDETNEVEKTVNIRIIKELQKELKKGVAAGLANTPPVADAGSDISGFPGQKIILDASKSFDREGLLSIPETYTWYENNNLIGNNKVIEKRFPLGAHNIKLTVTDSEGLTAEDTITVTIEEKKACKNTQTIYYPKDTLCNNKWPIKEGKEFKINSLTDPCSLFEVCSDELDYIIEDSIKCCTEELDDLKKTSVCNFAIENSKTVKNCQALYTIESLGPKAIYMDGYFDAEMCCKGVQELCPKTNYLYTPQPLPDYLKGVKCSNTPENNPNGLWKSDTKLELNEIALFDAPAHASLNVLKTGTCVDYSVAATTLLRKIGFLQNQIISVEASNHAYNLIRFDLDKKYTIFDMTGNNNGLTLGKVPSGYNYCENIINCYNDLGKVTCPTNKEIIGCENAKENIGRTTGTVGSKIQNIFVDLFNKIKAEILR